MATRTPKPFGGMDANNEWCATRFTIKTLADLHAAYAERTALLDKELLAEAEEDHELAERISMRRDELFDAIEEYEEAQFKADMTSYHDTDQAIWG